MSTAGQEQIHLIILAQFFCKERYTLQLVRIIYKQLQFDITIRRISHVTRSNAGELFKQYEIDLLVVLSHPLSLPGVKCLAWGSSHRNLARSFNNTFSCLDLVNRLGGTGRN